MLHDLLYWCYTDVRVRHIADCHLAHVMSLSNNTFAVIIRRFKVHIPVNNKLQLSLDILDFYLWPFFGPLPPDYLRHIILQ